jgi:polysaccharide deacetylase family protein (PEP-CTERM system associated)
MNSSVTNPRHLLTILVEDYFHVGAFENLIQQRNWANFEPRYERNTLKALDLLDEYGRQATFFVLGWIAEQNPSLVREIARRGHEVASRGYYHRSLKNLTNEEFREDLRRSSHAIGDASGQRVVGYRAAEKLTYDRKSWVLDILADEGFAYDASFLPKRGDDRSKWSAHEVASEAGSIWEFPYSTRDVGLVLVPISGGNYFRQIPYTLMRHAVRDWHARHDEPFVSYFHVWELDPEQPRISAANRYNRIRHYRKLDKMEWIIRENLVKYDCVSIADHLGLLRSSPLERPEAVVEATSSVSRAGTSEAVLPVTIVLPCYNEQEALPYLANTLRSLEVTLKNTGYDPSFIFVDDCSTDGTRELLAKLFGEWPNVKVVHHESNQGVAAGIMTGIREASTDLVCSMDCDCTYDPHELANMLPLMKGGVDLVTASPYHRLGGVRNVPGWRLFLSKGASFLYRRVLNAKLNTYTSCFRVYRRDAFVELDLTEKGFLGVAEMLGRLDLSGGRIVEFPAVLDVRLFGISKMKTARTIGGHVKLLSRLAQQRLFRKDSAINTSISLKDRHGHIEP